MEIFHAGPDFILQDKIGKQTAEMQFFCEERSTKNRKVWYVSFIVFTKRKDIDRSYNNNLITGLSGAASFGVAKQMLNTFETFIVQKYPEASHEIVIAGADALRRRIYGHFLPRLGYSECRYDRKWAMRKKFGIPCKK